LPVSRCGGQQCPYEKAEKPRLLMLPRSFPQLAPLRRHQVLALICHQQTTRALAIALLGVGDGALRPALNRLAAGGEDTNARRLAYTGLGIRPCYRLDDARHLHEKLARLAKTHKARRGERKEILLVALLLSRLCAFASFAFQSLSLCEKLLTFLDAPTRAGLYWSH